MACYFGELPLSIDDSIRIIEAFQTLRLRETLMNITDRLAPLRAHTGARRTTGLDDATVVRFAATHPELVEAIDDAVAEHARVAVEFPELLDLDEAEQAHVVQGGYVNFYSDDTVNPYIALVARGPWVVTLNGAVLHDSGGYGMLGFGHTPKHVLEAMARPQVMANIMTPNLSQLRFDRALRAEVGHSRASGTRDGCPYTKFLCLNSGSESVSLASRIADVNSKLMTDAGGRHAGRPIKRLGVKGSFHGRTERPALFSDSSRKTYIQHLASFRGEDSLLTVEPYDIDALKKVFADAERNGWFIEAMFLEPVMGEGDPGRAVPPAFYKAARELTKAHGALLLVDSIQAGLRAHGVLSIVDYPGFEGIEAPDMETYSKALNAGQYPLSVLAVTEHAAGLYRKGVYGNTMTTNPRALDVACAVLEQITPQLRANIRERGKQAIAMLESLKSELGGLITKVQGTGLLFSCELDPQFKGYGIGSTEEWLRERGMGVIHGGANSLRFTPHFAIGEDELKLMVDLVRRSLLEGPRQQQAAAA
jgi:acetylornithine/succinyldiaminopimelate/putrescine aminotransferase